MPDMRMERDRRTQTGGCGHRTREQTSGALETDTDGHRSRARKRRLESEAAAAAAARRDRSGAIRGGRAPWGGPDPDCSRLGPLSPLQPQVPVLFMVAPAQRGAAACGSVREVFGGYRGRPKVEQWCPRLLPGPGKVTEAKTQG